MAEFRLPKKVPEGGIIGIDPGRSSGGIAYVWAQGKGAAWKLEKMTDRDIWELIRRLSEGAKSAVLEHVNAKPRVGKDKEGKKTLNRMGATSAFSFGGSFHELKMALIASGVPFQLVTPVKWQTVLGCRTKGDKRISKAAAERLFPLVYPTKKRVTMWSADALLLAVYGFGGTKV